MPNLAPPGAGLPLPELFIARIRFRLICWRTNVQDALSQFQEAQAQILDACDHYGRQRASEQVLIKRLRGLEDSSRNWSIYMTIEHLRIVNDAIGDACVLLSQSKVPERAANTAEVKPSRDTGEEVIDSFRESCAKFVEQISVIDNLKTSTKFDHPWFGPLDASQWLVLAAFHMRLHLAQVHRIGKSFV